MKYWFLLITCVVAVLLNGCAESETAPAPPADHHIHILSEASTAFVSDQLNTSIDPISGQDIVQQLDSARVEQGVLLSVAYFFGMPDTSFTDEYAKVRAENDYVAQQAAQYPDRLTAFCSVNPLASYAFKEIERCAQKPHLDGLKLQLANSDVNLRDSTEVQRLAEVFARANRLDLPIVIHLWTRHPDYGQKDAAIFIREVLAEAPDVPVQIAHLGGKGMFDDATAGALQAFNTAIENDAAIMDDDVVFDLGAVTADPEAALARGDTTRAQHYRKTNERVARWVQKIGVDRVVYGSDYFARPIPDYVETIRSLPLDEAATRDLFDNTAPYLR